MAEDGSGSGLQGFLNKRREAKRIGIANVRTAVRTRQRVPEIKRRTPRSGVEVTRPTENRFLNGPNVTGTRDLL